MNLLEKNLEKYGPEGWTPDRIGSLKWKTFLITGASSGTGLEASKILASKGAKVVMLNRNPKKSEEVIAEIKSKIGNNVDLSFIKMDLGSLKSVKEAYVEINKNIDKIDALICNGAIAQVPKQVLTVDGFESQLWVNHYGHFLLQSLLFPIIDKSKWRIVTVWSMGYDMWIKRIKFEDMNWDKWYSANSAYSASKLVQIMSIYELQDRLEKAWNTNVKAYACHPGSSRTSLITTSGSSIMKFIFWLMTKLPLTQSAEKWAYPELMCAIEKDLDQKGFYGPTWRSNWVGPVWEHEIKSHAKDKSEAKKLWDLSEKETESKWEF